MVFGEIIIKKMEQFFQWFSITYGSDMACASNGRCRKPVRSRSTPNPEVYPARGHCFEHAKLFGNYQWREIREHHTSGSQSDMFCFADQTGKHDCWRRCGNSRHGMVFRNPIAGKPTAIGKFRKCNTLVYTLDRGKSFARRCPIQYGKWHRGNPLF